MKCSADGEPKPAIVISKIRPNGFKLLGNKIAIVKGIHLGIYECKAVNKHGTIKYPFLIKIRGEFQRCINYLTYSRRIATKEMGNEAKKIT